MFMRDIDTLFGNNDILERHIWTTKKSLLWG